MPLKYTFLIFRAIFGFKLTTVLHFLPISPKSAIFHIYVFLGALVSLAMLRRLIFGRKFYMFYFPAGLISYTQMYFLLLYLSTAILAL